MIQEYIWIAAGVVLLGLSVLFILFPGLKRLLGRLMLNAALGLGLIWGCNMLLGNAYAVTLSPASAAVCSLFGVPGAAALLLIKRFF